MRFPLWSGMCVLPCHMILRGRPGQAAVARDGPFASLSSHRPMWWMQSGPLGWRNIVHPLGPHHLGAIHINGTKKCWFTMCWTFRGLTELATWEGCAAPSGQFAYEQIKRVPGCPAGCWVSANLPRRSPRTTRSVAALCPTPNPGFWEASHEANLALVRRGTPLRSRTCRFTGDVFRLWSIPKVLWVWGVSKSFSSKSSASWIVTGHLVVHDGRSWYPLIMFDPPHGLLKPWTTTTWLGLGRSRLSAPQAWAVDSWPTLLGKRHGYIYI